jgi:hypothetical protein
MIWLGLYRLFSILLDLIIMRRLAIHEKDIEIVLLRQQLGLLERTQRRAPRKRQISGRRLDQGGFIGYAFISTPQES